MIATATHEALSCACRATVTALAALALLASPTDAYVAEDTICPEDAAFLDSVLNEEFGFDPVVTIRSYRKLAEASGVDNPGVVYSVRFAGEFTGSELDGRKLMASVIAAGRTAAGSSHNSYILATVFTGNGWIMTIDTDACVRYSEEFMDHTPEETSEFLEQNVIHSGHM